jgi:IS1 family transposase
MNQLDSKKRAQVVAALVEGNSIRATVRMTGVAKNTIAKLLVELGAACSEYLNKTLVNLTCKRVQCDEIWTFVAAKERNVTDKIRERSPQAGDAWTWVAMDADTKLVCSWMVGRRDWVTAQDFVNDLQSRLANRIQLTTDGNRLYLFAINTAFQGDVDYAVLMKLYGGTVSETATEIRYSPAQCIGCEKKPKIGDPDPKHISTSFVERQNLTMRMQMRRFTRLTNAFSKKIENHVASIAIHYMHYNFCRIHQTLRVTPAMAAGISDHVWDVKDLVGLLGESGKE